MDKIELKIVTPEKVVYQDLVESVSIPTVDGEITVLPGHIPIISGVKAGELRIKKGTSQDMFSITRGVAEVDGHTITILTDAAEKAEDIDEKRAEEARKKAKDLMSSTKVDEEGYADAVAQLERALSRMRIARKKRRGSRVSLDQ
jgi:F-type H+-transporting ATPase subunit epsilon